MKQRYSNRRRNILAGQAISEQELKNLTGAENY
jgi:hypothetical protein